MCHFENQGSFFRGCAMSDLNRKRLLVAVVASFASAAGGVKLSAATTLFVDNFNNAAFDGAPLAGRQTNPTDLPGSTYSSFTFNNQSPFISTTTIPNGTPNAYIANATASALDLTNNGGTPLPAGT